TSVTINGAANADDQLTIDYAFGGLFFIPGGIAFNGGSGTGNNVLHIHGGTFATDTYDYTNAHDGKITLAGGSGTQVANYTQLQPLMNDGTAPDIVFNLPDGTVVATLHDDATPNDNMSELVSNNGAFEVTGFLDPTGSLTINAGNGADTLTLQAL